MSFVYILKCNDDSLYTGWTNDLKKRIKAHSNGKGAILPKYITATLSEICLTIDKSCAILIIFFVGIFSLIISRFNMEQTIQNIKSILLIVGALGMILGALLIINIKK